MDEAAFHDLVESVYDLALEPAALPDLLRRLADAFGAHAASFAREHMESGRGDGYALGLDPIVPGQYFDHYSTCNVLRRIDNVRERMKTFVPTVMVDEESLPKSELVETEFYVDFLKPAGIHSVITIGLWNRGLEVCVLDLFRPANRTSFGAAELELAFALQPHLIRAFRLGAKVADAQQLGRGLATALDQSWRAMIILDRDGRLRHANAAGERILAQRCGLDVAAGRLIARDAVDSGRLQALIAAAAAGAGGSMSVRRPGGRTPLSLTVTPVSAERTAPYLGDPGIVVCVTDADLATCVPERRLAELYGLTSAQAKVARALLDGRSLREAADALELSIFTVRAHLARIFEKTGARRQAELVALLSRGVDAQAGFVSRPG